MKVKRIVGWIVLIVSIIMLLLSFESLMMSIHSGKNYSRPFINISTAACGLYGSVGLLKGWTYSRTFATVFLAGVAIMMMWPSGGFYLDRISFGSFMTALVYLIGVGVLFNDWLSSQREKLDRKG